MTSHLGTMSSSGSHLSKEFFALVKAIGESRSKQEEDRIVSAEVRVLKQRLSEPNVPSLKMKELLIRAIYVEMLGHDASFAQIHAIKLAHDKNLACKQVGYLACCLGLDESSDLLLLLINTLQKDLLSTSYAETCFALSCLASPLLSDEMIAAVIPQTQKLCVSHPQESVRRKALMVLFTALRKRRDTFPHQADLKNLIRQALCDHSPSVMAASLHLIHHEARQDPDEWRDLVPSIVSVLKQVIEHRLPREYDHHRVPAPWIQIKLLSVLATLCSGSQEATDEAKEVLAEIIRRADITTATAGFAISYECIRTITAVMPDEKLINLASQAVGRFISSQNHNLRYVGISGLSALIRVNPALACRPEHQLVVLDCLEDCDETLKRRTLSLLYTMTNPANAVVVTEKLLQHLKNSNDEDFRRELVQKVSRLADRFAPNHAWFVTTLNTLFQLGGPLVPSKTEHDLLRLIAEGVCDEDNDDDKTRRSIVNMYLEMLQQPGATPLQEAALRCAAWTIGEYGSLNTVAGFSDLESIIALLASTLKLNYCASTQSWVLGAIFKLSALRFLTLAKQASPPLQNWPERNWRVPPEVVAICKRYRKSMSSDLALRCHMFAVMFLRPKTGTPLGNALALISELFAFDAACEDITLDFQLSFLDSYTEVHLRNGGRAYSRPKHSQKGTGTHRTADDSAPAEVTLRYVPYEEPMVHRPKGVLQDRAPISRQSNVHTISPSNKADVVDFVPVSQQETTGTSTDQSLFKRAGPRKWGPEGYKGEVIPKSTRKSAQVTTTAAASLSASSSVTSNVAPESAPNVSTDNHQRRDRGSAPSRQTFVDNRTRQIQKERELAAKALFSGLAPDAPVSTKPSPSLRPGSKSKEAKPNAKQKSHSGGLGHENEAPSSKSHSPGLVEGLDLLELNSTVDLSSSVDRLDTSVQKKPKNVVNRKNKKDSTKVTDIQMTTTHAEASDSGAAITDLLDTDFDRTANEDTSSAGPNVPALKPALHFTTELFGQEWQNQKCTLTIAGLSAYSTLETFLDKMRDLHFATVAIVGVEGLSASLMEEENLVVLAHVKSDGIRIDLTLRSNDSAILNDLLAQMRTTFFSSVHLIRASE